MPAPASNPPSQPAGEALWQTARFGSAAAEEGRKGENPQLTFLRYELARIYSDRRESSQKPEPPLPSGAATYDDHVLTRRFGMEMSRRIQS